MSIKRTRNSKAFITDLKDAVGNDYISPSSVVCSSHSQHIVAIWFFKFKIWYKQFAHMREKISGKFNTIKISSRSFSFIDYFDATVNSVKSIYMGFINTMNLKLQHVLSATCFCQLGSFRDKKTAISIDESSQVNKIISCNFRKITNASTYTHNSPFFEYSTDIVQYLKNYVNRDRLNEWDAKAYAIVGPL